MRVRGMVYLWTLCILLLPAWSVWGQPFYTVTDLNARIHPRAGWVLGHAQDMNDVGQIVGQGWLNGQVRCFLLTPADETTALAAYEVVKDVRETLPAHMREWLPAGLFHR